MANNTSWDQLTLEQKLISAGIDIMSHSKFALLAGCVVMGKMEVKKDLPTAATNGRDEWFGQKFLEAQNRRQLRWIRLHENLHKALHHCTEYKAIMEKYGMLANMAQDFVINAFIDELDPSQQFAQHPVDEKGQPLQICLDKKYYGKSFIEVLNDLLKNANLVKMMQAGNGKGGGGKGTPGPFDEHLQGTEDMTAEEREGLKRDIEDALRQGKILCEKLAGNEKGGNPLDALTVVRQTNWRDQLRQFIAQIISGWDQSRYCPPNKRLLPHCLMPSHYTEVTGEIIVACDTSGSMGGVYPIVFGEIVRIAENVKPEAIRLIWWDTAVCGEQRFLPADFDKMAKMLKPEGGGGTSLGCVGTYIKKKEYKPKALIILTDGYLDGTYTPVETEVLFGVLDNTSFTAPQGRVIHLSSDAM